MLQTVQEMSVVDLLRCGALVVGFLAVMFGDQKGSSSVWLKADAILLVLQAPGIIFPDFFLNLQVCAIAVFKFLQSPTICLLYLSDFWKS
jgi:hypothetical protein